MAATKPPGMADELALLRAILNESPVVVYAKDTDLRFVLSNVKHAGLLQLPASEVLGRRDEDLFGDEAAPVDDTSLQVLRDGEPAIAEFALTLPEGERVFHETIFRLCDPQGTPIGLGGIATDITRRIELEEEVRKKNARLETMLEELQQTRKAAAAAERMASLGTLVAGLGHEVNTPLSVARLALTIAREQAQALQTSTSNTTSSQPNTDKILESLQLAEEQIGRITNLMTSFREVAVDRVHIELRNTSLQGWLHVAAQTLVPICRQHGVRLTWHPQQDLKLRLAVGVLHQIASNLVVNACVHAFEGLDVERQVDLTIAPTAEGLTLCVEDNGRGVPDEVIGKLFEPFFTTRRGTGGTGLGLHIVYNMVVGTLGGTIHYEHRESGGARFVVRIPFQPETAMPLDQSTVEVELNPDLPLALWEAFAADLRTRAVNLRRMTAIDDRQRLYRQLVGSLGIYGLNTLAEQAQQAATEPESLDRAHALCDSIEAHAAAIEAKLPSLPQ